MAKADDTTDDTTDAPATDAPATDPPAGGIEAVGGVGGVVGIAIGGVVGLLLLVCCGVVIYTLRGLPKIHTGA